MLNKKEEILSAIIASTNLKDLEELRIYYLGKNGLLTQAMKNISSLSIEEKKTFGADLNNLKNLITDTIATHKNKLEQEAILVQISSEKIDITQPIRSNNKTGKIHPTTQALHEIINIFSSFGFSSETAPEIEDDYHNFTALNIPENHPARQMHDTFYLNTKNTTLLRTHTSNVQVRIMKSGKPPFKFIAPGRVYRSDYDQTHSPMFHQLEGIYIAEGITMAHLKGCLEEFLRLFFETDDVIIRLRPSFFPFTEPSAEVDIGYRIENGELKIGSSQKWLEILGCGMVHRTVIENAGLDPDKYQGYAFGIGIDRLAMLKYGLNDLRKFFDSDLRWINQVGFSYFDIPNLLSGLTK